MGEVKIETDKNEEDLFEIGIEAGADDVMMIDDGAILHCAPSSLNAVGTYLEKNDITVQEQQFIYKPNQTIEVTDLSIAKKLVKLLDAFDENEDVQNVFNNADINDALIEEL